MRRSLLILTLCVAATDAPAQELRPAYTEVAGLAQSPVNAIVESPDGRFLWYSVAVGPAGSTELRVLNRALGSSRSIGKAHADYAWSPRGDMVAYARLDDRKEWLFIWTVRVDALSGMPVGEPRRVSVTPGRGPVFSPDGRAIAFTVIPPTDTASPRIVVVSLQGGEERVLVRAPGYVQQLNWTTDSRWIYYRNHSSWSVDNIVSANRVAARGGAPQTLRRVADVIGLSKDAKFLAYYPSGPSDRDRRVVGISNADGVELGHFALPRFLEPFSWSSGFGKLIALRYPLPTGISVVSLRSGAPYELSGADVYDEPPNFSPDGRLLGFVSYANDRRQLVVMPASGGARRIVTTRAEPDRAPIRWSPDGRYLAFISEGARTLHAVDVATGAETRLSARGTITWDAIAWRTDGLALFFVRTTDERREVVEVSLGGVERRVRTLQPELGGWLPITFVGDSLYLVGADDAVYIGGLRDGTLRRLFASPAGTAGAWLYGIDVSPDGRLAAVPVTSKDSTRRQFIHVVPLDGGAPRAVPIQLSFESRFYWHPDAQHLIVVGQRQEGTGVPDVFLIPLNGEPMRSLAKGGKALGVRGVSIHPAGESIAFSRLTAAHISLWEIDLSRDLRAYNGGQP